jgi:MGT family glycosyltransferase
VEPTGADVIAHSSLLPLGDKSWPEDIGEAMQLFLDESIATLPLAARTFVGGNLPDIILYDIGGFSGRVFGHQNNIPSIQLSPAHVAWEGYSDDMAETFAAMDKMPTVQSYYRTFNNWLRTNNIQQDAKEWLGHPEHIIALIPKPMQPRAERVASNVCFVGPCIDPQRLADTSWESPDKSRRVLLVSFGTAYNDKLQIYRDCIEGFANSDWHVVIAIGQRLERSQLGEIPSNVEIFATAPQLAVLKRASAFITHAGMGGCSEALWFGVPTIAIPQAVDQFTNADMLSALGVGERLDEKEVTALKLREAVERISSSIEVREKLDKISTSVQKNGGIDKAVHATERFFN